jgi:hypothetical protein
METTLVMIGLEPLADYVANLQRELNIPLMKAKEIALDISEHIFKPIRESLQKMNEESMEEEGTADKEIERAQIESETDSQNNLDREQILDEIENPVPNRPSLQQNPMGQSPAVNTSGQLETKPNQGLEIRPVQNIEIRPSQNLIEDKMKNSTIVSEQIIHAVPETKLPEVKKKPYSGIDPYKEPLN